MAKISQREKQLIVKFLIGLVASALLWTPIDNFITGVFGTGSARLWVGIALLVSLAFVNKLKI